MQKVNLVCRFWGKDSDCCTTVPVGSLVCEGCLDAPHDDKS